MIHTTNYTLNLYKDVGPWLCEYANELGKEQGYVPKNFYWKNPFPEEFSKTFRVFHGNDQWRRGTDVSRLHRIVVAGIPQGSESYATDSELFNCGALFVLAVTGGLQVACAQQAAR